MKTWLARALFALTTAGLVVLGFFFFTIALIVGGAIALVVGARLWWTLRKLKREGVDPFSPSRAAQPADEHAALDGEYQVVERETGNPRLPEKDLNSTPPAP